jgi:hypothetical protein
MRRVEALAVVAVSLGLVSCGDGGTTPPTPVPTPTPAPVRTVVAQGSFAIEAPDEELSYYRSRLIKTTATGTLETTVNWTYPTNAVWMYLTEGDCTDDQFDNLDCPGGPTCECRFIVLSETETPKPRVLTVSNASAGTRTLIVWNLGPQEESCSFQAVLTTSVAGSSPTGPQGAAVETGRGRRPRRPARDR